MAHRASGHAGLDPEPSLGKESYHCEMSVGPPCYLGMMVLAPSPVLCETALSLLTQRAGRKSSASGLGSHFQWVVRSAMASSRFQGRTYEHHECPSLRGWEHCNLSFSVTSNAAQPQRAPTACRTGAPVGCSIPEAGPDPWIPCLLWCVTSMVGCPLPSHHVFQNSLRKLELSR